MKTHFTLIILFISVQLFAQQNIADVRNQVGREVTVAGIVTNGEELGSIRYFQDETAGLAAYGDQTGGIKRGDLITISGTLKDYNNLLELDPITSVAVHSSGNTLPAPKVITIDEIGESYEGQLIQINNVKITDAGGTFAGSQNYAFKADGKTGELRINRNSPIVGEVIPTDAFNLVAIISQYSFDNPTDGYQLLPRDMEDFISVSPVNFISPVQVSEITTDGFALTWETDVDASSEIRYGTTTDKSQWKYIKSDISLTAENSFLHKAYVTGLNPSSIVYAEAFSVLETDTAFSSIGVYATQSGSSGMIRVYFNTEVDHSVATGELAQNVGNAMEDTLIAYLNRAEETIDFAIYNINNGGLSNVSEALNAAQNRGVRVRFITDGSTNHFGTDDLDAGIPVLERPEIQQGGIMHNKFTVIDANSTDADKPWIWTGSTNISFDQINTDANNSVFIQDQSLAKAYELEFEEMWGSAGEQPNAANAKFGDEKTDNTPHHFKIGEITVESYFSPSDNTNQKIIQSIQTADHDLNIETMLITRTDLALAIADATQRGADVQVITDDDNDNSETVNDILNDNLTAGKFVFDDAVAGILHNKIAIVDARLPGSDPQVITGSHNWSNSANNRNDENTLIIHSPEIANIFFQQFAERFAANGGALNVSASEIQRAAALKIFPNPVSGSFQVQSETTIEKIQIFEASGMRVFSVDDIGSKSCAIDFSKQKPGIYVVVTELANRKITVAKLVKK